jgi:hypothetical protein
VLVYTLKMVIHKIPVNHCDYCEYAKETSQYFGYLIHNMTF